MAVVDVLARIKADASGFNKGIGEAERTLNRFSTSAVAKGTVIGNVLYRAAERAASGFGRILVGAFKESIQASKETQAAQNRLARLLLNTNGATEAQIQILHAHASALEQSTVVSKGNIAVVQSQLATFDLHGSTIAKLTPAILDYVVAERGAAASADTFRSYTNGLAQALNGQFGSLSRVGFVLNDHDKKMIKTGTESERAAAIVRILNTTYKDFASINGGAANAQIQLSKAIGQVKEDFGTALRPAIEGVQSSISTKFIPVLQDLQARFASKEAIGKFITFVKELGGNLKDFAQAVITVVEPVFTGFLVPAIKGIIATLIQFIKILGAVGRFIKNNATAFQILAGVLLAVTAGVIAYRIQVLVLNGVSKAWALVTGKVTKAIKMLNLAMRMNPIGFVIGLITALAAGFVMLWNKSDTFRKMVIQVGKVFFAAVAKMIRAVAPFAETIIKLVTGPMRGFLGILSKIPGVGKYFKAAKEFADKAVDGIAEFATSAADKIEAFGDSLDKYSAKKVKAPKIEKPIVPDVDLSALGTAGGGKRVDEKEKKRLEKLAKQMAEYKRDLQEAVDKYNEYITGDFSESFTKGADHARDAVGKALDNLKDVFDKKAKMLKDQGSIDKLYQVFDNVKKKIAPLVDQYADVARQIEEINVKIEKALDALEKAIADRAEAQADIGELLRTPFGEPSELRKAMSSAEASVDSIINAYDRIKALVTKRFTGMPDESRDMLIRYFEAQTRGLIELAKRREKAVKVLENAQQDLQNLVDEQKGFTTDIQKSLKDFATALIDISESDGKAVYTVTKTATGLVISQTKKSTNAVDAITKNLQAKLDTIVKFGDNVNKLLAKGLNSEYIRQLLGAGPEAAGQTAAALALASDEQIATINKLYKDINTQATNFSTNMGQEFYGAAIGMAENFKLGAELGLELINAVMYDITTNIGNVLSILGNTGLTNAEALVNALNAEFTRQANETVGPATQLIVDKIRMVLSVLPSISLVNAQAFMDGLINTLGGEDNRARYTASADQIRANIDTIMKLLAPQALTSGLGLIASLVSAFGGTNLESIKTAVTGIKDAISTILDTLKAKGTEFAADLMQNAYNQLLKDKERLVALAKSIDENDNTEDVFASASVGVDVADLGGGDGGD